jgi:hypothetical protein
LSRWFRHYAGMMRDDKLVRVAIRSKQAIERVVWIWGAVLESAAEIDDGGRFDIDPGEIAYFLRADQDDVELVLSGLADAGRIREGVVVKWGDRQFISDRSAYRVRRHRERKKDGYAEGRETPVLPHGNDAVTLHAASGNAPETETELETENTPPTPRTGGRRGKHVLPQDWEVPTVADLPPKARACAEQWTAASYETHGEAFVSYWRGEGKMKSDWRGTWANRVVALHSQVLRDQKFGNAPTASASATPADRSQFEALCDSEAARLRAIGNEREAKNWEAKKANGAERRESTGPPRQIAQLIPQIQASPH